MKMSKTVVRFINKWGTYNVGEIAGFDKPEAKMLIDAGLAVGDKAPNKKHTVTTPRNRPRLQESNSVSSMNELTIEK